jgi:hypothetical protein
MNYSGHRPPKPPPPAKRQVIQMVGTSTPDGDPDLYALCNDGTMWGLNSGGQWVEMPPIPQDESQDPLAKLYAKNVDTTERLLAANRTIEAIQRKADEYVACPAFVVNKIGRELNGLIIDTQ